MSEKQDVEPTANEREARQISVRAELKKNLAEEFTAALELQEGLTDLQRLLLHSLITDQPTTSTAILQVLRSTENQ